jgi:hypothetical protein
VPPLSTLLNLSREGATDLARTTGRELAQRGTSAALRGASALGEAAGEGARYAGRGLRYTGEAAMSPMGRKILGTGAGAGLGYGASQAVPDYVDPWVSTAFGGAAGLAATSPGFRDQLRYAGRVPEEGRWGLKNVWNLAARPRYPGIEPALERAMPKWGPRIMTGARLAPWAAAGAGAGVSGYGMLTAYPDQIDNLAWNAGLKDKAARNDLWWRAFRRSPQMLAETYGPSWMGRDTTPVGDVQREFFRKSMIPGSQFGIHQIRQQHPYLAGTIDAMRSTSPLGFATTRYAQRFARSEPPDEAGILREVLRNQRENVLGRMGEIPDSPLLKDYSDLLTHPSVLNDPGIQHWAGEQAGGAIPNEQLRLGHGRSINPLLSELEDSSDNPLNHSRIFNADRYGSPYRNLIHAPVPFLPKPVDQDFYGQFRQAPRTLPKGVGGDVNMFNPYTGVDRSARWGLGKAITTGVGRLKEQDPLHSPKWGPAIRGVLQTPEAQQMAGSLYDQYTP